MATECGRRHGLHLRDAGHLADLELVGGGASGLGLILASLVESPACRRRHTLALAAGSGGEVHGVEAAVDEAGKGRGDLVLVVSDRAHTAEKHRLIGDNVEGVGLRDGDPLAHTEVEEFVIRIQTGVDGGEEEGGKVGEVDGRPRQRPASNVLDDGRAGLATKNPGHDRVLPATASATAAAVSARPGAPLPPAVGRDVGAAVRAGGGAGLGRRRRLQRPEARAGGGAGLGRRQRLQQDRRREFRGCWWRERVGGSREVLQREVARLRQQTLQQRIAHWVFPRRVQEMHLTLGRGGGFAVAVWVEESGVGRGALFCWAALRGARGRKGRDKKKHNRTYSDVVFAFVGPILALARSGQKLGAKRFRTESVAGVDHHGVVVREERHRVGRGITKGKTLVRSWERKRKEDGCFSSSARSAAGRVAVVVPNWKVFNGGSDRVLGIEVHMEGDRRGRLHFILHCHKVLDGVESAIRSRVSEFDAPGTVCRRSRIEAAPEHAQIRKARERRRLTAQNNGAATSKQLPSFPPANLLAGSRQSTSTNLSSFQTTLQGNS
ncbi:hypothetical protein B0H14DRAFT_3164387 [Mycena olivaceomarginata]|nr:hypothetical protein B0H14DRAFT_3164387 [Mycena olivaceomarginata]